ncbi:MAG: hypothetical protein JNN15_07060, partial [Blastocatellia bacterium]|nr:hypothetical protein [Blastocatellia bacterium]
MEQFEQLLSKFKDYSATELRLEANQKPHYITPSGIREISSFPIQHKDIVMLLSPILPATAKSELMERTGTEFTHKSQSGSFIVNVKKSNIGFNVTVRPVGNSGPIGNSTINNPVSSTPPLFPASSSGPLKPLNQSPSPPPASTRQPQAPTPPP